MDRAPVREMLTPLARAYSARACYDIRDLKIQRRDGDKNVA